jgi:hypothetical protein
MYSVHKSILCDAGVNKIRKAEVTKRYVNIHHKYKAKLAFLAI